MRNIIGTVKRILFTKNRKQKPIASEEPELESAGEMPFDIFEPADVSFPEKKVYFDDDDDFDAPLPPQGFFAKLWVSEPLLWIRRVEIKARTGMSTRQRIKRYNAIHQGGYGAPDSSVKTKR